MRSFWERPAPVKYCEKNEIGINATINSMRSFWERTAPAGYQAINAKNEIDA